MAIGDTITQPIPAVGTAGTTYASELVAFLEEVKTRLEADVPMSSLLVGLLDMSNNAIQNLDYVGLYAKTSAPTTPVGSLQRYQNNLYWVSNAGAVRLTNGAALDVTSIGGITGDYGGANPAQFRFSDADKEYYAYDDYGGLAWARLGAIGLDIYGTLTNTTRVRLAWAGAANPSYTLTLPATLPAATNILTLSSSGAVGINGTLGADQLITMSGAGRLLTGERRYTHSVNFSNCISAAGTSVSSGAPGLIIAASSTVWVPIELQGPGWYEGGGVVKLSKLGIHMDTASANNTSYSIVTTDGTGAAFSAALTGTSATTTADYFVIELTDPAEAQLDGNPLWLKIVTAAGSGRILVALSPYVIHN